jgi:hypothetical protein
MIQKSFNDPPATKAMLDELALDTATLLNHLTAHLEHRFNKLENVIRVAND